MVVITYDTVFIIVNDIEIFIPTAFTPNGDGMNDVFHVIDKNIEELIYLRVFNRWGQLLFETDNLNLSWDGTYKSKAQEMDIYIYDLIIIEERHTKEDTSEWYVYIVEVI